MGNKCCKSNQSSTYSSANATVRSFSSSYNSSILRSGGSHALTFGNSTRGNSLTDLTMKSNHSDGGGRDFRGGSSSNSDIGRDYRGGSSSTIGQEDPIPIFLRRLNDLNIRVGTRTRFLIELDDPTGVQVRWFHNNAEAESERYQYIHEGGFYCLDIVPVTLDDEGLWVCTAQNYAGKSSTAARLSLTVPKAFKKPVFVESLRAVLTQRGIVSLECKVVGVPTPKLRWYKDDKEIKAGDIFALTASASQDCLGVYTCEATNVMGTAVSSSRIQVTHSSMDGKCDAESLVPYGPPPKFAKGLKDAAGKVGSSLFLECQVEVPPWPRNVGWYNSGGVVNDGPLYHLMADGLGMYGVEIKSLRADHGSTWKCVATSSTGAKAVTSCLVSVSHPKNYRVPRFLESLRAIMTDEGLVSFECKVIGYPTPQLLWFKDGKQLQPGDVYELTGSKSLGSYCCVARNCMGETSSLAELTIEDIQNQLNESEKLQLTSNTQPPRFLLGLKSAEANINESFVFTIKVTTESTPSISWYKEDEELAESNRYRFSTEENGTYLLNIMPLEIDDQAEWKCVAVNKYGQTVTSSFLKLNVPKNYKPPRFLEELRIAFSNEGSVNLECKVIGVPQPQLKWFKDGQELNPGDMHKIISGQSGTCCLGTYTCQAHNCMGTVASSATLLTMEDKSTVKSCTTDEYLSVGNPLVRNESLSTIPEERTSQMEKSYTIEEPADVSFSFDGKEVTVSLYETPDLTHDEALQIIEMYADELSEHISEDNIVDLPSLRIVKESSISGPVMMEALVIDVPVGFCQQQTASDTDMDGLSLTEDTTLANDDEIGDKRSISPLENSLEYFSDHLSSGGNSKPELFFSASETTPKNGSSPDHASFRTPKLFMSDSDDQILTQLMLDGGSGGVGKRGSEHRKPIQEMLARSESNNTEEEVSETLAEVVASEPPPLHEILAQTVDEGLYSGAVLSGTQEEDDLLLIASRRDADEFLRYMRIILEGAAVKMHARQSFAVTDTPTELERSVQALHTLAWRFVDETERRGPGAELDGDAAENVSGLMAAINAGLLALEQIDDPFGVSDNVLNEVQSAVRFDLETLNDRTLSAAQVLDLVAGQVRDFTAAVNRQVARVTEQRVAAVLRNTIGTTLVYVKTLQQNFSKIKCVSAGSLAPLFSMVQPLETILSEVAAAEEAASAADGESGPPSRLKQKLIPPISTVAFCLDGLNKALRQDVAEDDPDLLDICQRINDATVQFMTLATQGTSETNNLAECFISFTKPVNDLCCHLRRLGRSTENIVSSDYGSDDKLLMDFETLFDELMMDIDTLINNVNVVRDSEDNVNPLGSLLEPLQDMKIGLFQVNQVLLSNQTAGSNMSYEVMSCFEHLSHQLVQLNSCIVNQSIVEETDKEIPFETSIKMMQNILFDDAIDDLGVNGILFGSVMKPLLQLQNLIVSKMASVESDLSFSEHTDATGAAAESLSLSLSNNAQTVFDKAGNVAKREVGESSAVVKDDEKRDEVPHVVKNTDEDHGISRGTERDIEATFRYDEPNIVTAEEDRDNSGFEALFEEADLGTDFVDYESLENNKTPSLVNTIYSSDKENDEVIPSHIMDLLDKTVQEDTKSDSSPDLFDELQETLKKLTEATGDEINDVYASEENRVHTHDEQESGTKCAEDLSSNTANAQKSEQTDRALDTMWDVDTTENIECMDSDKSISKDTIVPKNDISDPTDIKTGEIDDSSNSEGTDNKHTQEIVCEEDTVSQTEDNKNKTTVHTPVESEISSLNDNKLEIMGDVDKSTTIVSPSIDQGVVLETALVMSLSASEIVESANDFTDVDRSTDNVIDNGFFETKSAHSLNAENLETLTSTLNDKDELFIVKDDQQKLCPPNEIENIEPEKKTEVVVVDKQSISGGERGIETVQKETRSDSGVAIDEVGSLTAEDISDKTTPKSENVQDKSLEAVDEIVEQIEGKSSSGVSEDKIIVMDAIEKPKENIARIANEASQSSEVETKEIPKSDAEHDLVPLISDQTVDGKSVDKEPVSTQPSQITQLLDDTSVANNDLETVREDQSENVSTKEIDDIRVKEEVSAHITDAESLDSSSAVEKCNLDDLKNIKNTTEKIDDSQTSIEKTDIKDKPAETGKTVDDVNMSRPGVEEDISIKSEHDSSTKESSISIADSKEIDLTEKMKSEKVLATEIHDEAEGIKETEKSNGDLKQASVLENNAITDDVLCETSPIVQSENIEKAEVPVSLTEPNNALITNETVATESTQLLDPCEIDEKRGEVKYEENRENVVVEEKTVLVDKDKAASDNLECSETQKVLQHSKIEVISNEEVQSTTEVDETKKDSGEFIDESSKVLLELNVALICSEDLPVNDAQPLVETIVDLENSKEKHEKELEKVIESEKITVFENVIENEEIIDEQKVDDKNNTPKDVSMTEISVVNESTLNNCKQKESSNEATQNIETSCPKSIDEESKLIATEDLKPTDNISLENTNEQITPKSEKLIESVNEIVEDDSNKTVTDLEITKTNIEEPKSNVQVYSSEEISSPNDIDNVQHLDSAESNLANNKCSISVEENTALKSTEVVAADSTQAIDSKKENFENAKENYENRQDENVKCQTVDVLENVDNVSESIPAEKNIKSLVLEGKESNAYEENVECEETRELSNGDSKTIKRQSNVVIEECEAVDNEELIVLDSTQSLKPSDVKVEKASEELTDNLVDKTEVVQLNVLEPTVGINENREISTPDGEITAEKLTNDSADTETKGTKLEASVDSTTAVDAEKITREPENNNDTELTDRENLSSETPKRLTSAGDGVDEISENKTDSDLSVKEDSSISDRVASKKIMDTGREVSETEQKLEDVPLNITETEELTAKCDVEKELVKTEEPKEVKIEKQELETTDKPKTIVDVPVLEKKAKVLDDNVPEDEIADLSAGETLSSIAVQPKLHRVEQMAADQTECVLLENANVLKQESHDKEIERARVEHELNIAAIGSIVTDYDSVKENVPKSDEQDQHLENATLAVIDKHLTGIVSTNVDIMSAPALDLTEKTDDDITKDVKPDEFEVNSRESKSSNVENEVAEPSVTPKVDDDLLQVTEKIESKNDDLLEQNKEKKDEKVDDENEKVGIKKKSSPKVKKSSSPDVSKNVSNDKNKTDKTIVEKNEKSSDDKENTTKLETKVEQVISTNENVSKDEKNEVQKNTEIEVDKIKTANDEIDKDKKKRGSKNKRSSPQPQDKKSPSPAKSLELKKEESEVEEIVNTEPDVAEVEIISAKKLPEKTLEEENKAKESTVVKIDENPKTIDETGDDKTKTIKDETDKVETKRGSKKKKSSPQPQVKKSPSPEKLIDTKKDDSKIEKKAKIEPEITKDETIAEKKLSRKESQGEIKAEKGELVEETKNGELTENVTKLESEVKQEIYREGSVSTNDKCEIQKNSETNDDKTKIANGETGKEETKRGSKKKKSSPQPQVKKSPSPEKLIDTKNDDRTVEEKAKIESVVTKNETISDKTLSEKESRDENKVKKNNAVVKETRNKNMTENKIVESAKIIDKKNENQSDDKENAVKLETKVKQEISDEQQVENIEKSVLNDDECQKNDKIDANETKMTNDEPDKDKKKQDSKKRKSISQPKDKKSSSPDKSIETKKDDQRIEEKVKTKPEVGKDEIISVDKLSGKELQEENKVKESEVVEETKKGDLTENKIVGTDKIIDEKSEERSGDKENAEKLEAKVKQEISINDEKPVKNIEKSVSNDDVSQKDDKIDCSQTKTTDDDTDKDKKKRDTKKRKSISQPEDKKLPLPEKSIETKKNDQKVDEKVETRPDVGKDEKLSVKESREENKVKEIEAVEKARNGDQTENKSIENAKINDEKSEKPMGDKTDETDKDKKKRDSKKRKSIPQTKDEKSPSPEKSIETKKDDQKVEKKVETRPDVGKDEKLSDKKLSEKELQEKNKAKESAVVDETRNGDQTEKKIVENAKIINEQIEGPSGDKIDANKTETSNDETDKGKKKRDSKKRKSIPQAEEKSPLPEKSTETKKDDQKVEEKVENRPDVGKDDKLSEKELREENKVKESTVVEEMKNEDQTENKTVENAKIIDEKSEESSGDKTDTIKTKTINDETDKDKKKRDIKKRKSIPQAEDKKSPLPEKSIETKKDDQKVEENVETRSDVGKDAKESAVVEETKNGEQTKNKTIETSKNIDETNKKPTDDKGFETKVEQETKTMNDETDKANKKRVSKKKKSISTVEDKKLPLPDKSVETRKEDQKIEEKSKITVDNSENEIISESKISSEKESRAESKVKESVVVEDTRNEKPKSRENDAKIQEDSVTPKTRRSRHKKSPTPEKADTYVKTRETEEREVIRVNAGKEIVEEVYRSDADRSKDVTTPVRRRQPVEVDSPVKKPVAVREVTETRDFYDRSKDVTTPARRRQPVEVDSPVRKPVAVREVTETRDFNDLAREKRREAILTANRASPGLEAYRSSPDRRVAHDGHVDRSIPLSRRFQSSPAIVVDHCSASDRDLGRMLSKRYLNVADSYGSSRASSRSLTPEPPARYNRSALSSDRELSSGRNYFGGSCRSLSPYCGPETSSAYRRCPSETSVRRYRTEDEGSSSSSSSYWNRYGSRRRRGSDSFLHDPSARDYYYSAWRSSDYRSTTPLPTYADEDLNRTKETFRRLYFCVRLIDQTVCSGATVKFWCSVIGYPEPHVQWYRDGQKLNSYTYNASTRYQTKYTSGLAQLIIDDAQCCDSGEYTCVAVNSRDRATTTGFLTVYTSPSTFGAPRKSPMKSSTCPEVYRPKDRLYSWTGSEYGDWSDDFAGGRHPKYPKFLTGIIADDVVTSGGTISLQVRVRGSPAPNVTWMRESRPLPRTSSKYVYIDEGGLYTLLVRDITARDGGVYVCRACNLYGSADSEKSVRVAQPADHWSSSPEHGLRGAKPAEIVSRPGDRLNVAVGEDITVTLRVAGEPKPKVIWMRGSRDVTFLDRSLKETVNDYVKLSIKRAQLSDAGTYFIVAKNVYGSDRAFVTVGVSDRIRISPVPLQ